MASETERRHQPTWVHSLRWPAALVAVAGLAFGAYWLTLRQAAAGGRAAREAMSSVASSAERLAQSFFTGDVSESFQSSLPTVSAVEDGHLEVARMEITETLRRSDERRLAFDLLPLGTTTTEIVVPATYRYHVLLDDPWKVEVHGPVALVLAPPIRPTLPVAIDTRRLERRTEEGLFRFDGEVQMQDLERSLTPRLAERADSLGYRALVREEARRSIAAFVRKWLLQQSFWTEDRFATVKVVFAEELDSPSPVEEGDPGESTEIRPITLGDRSGEEPVELP